MRFLMVLLFFIAPVCASDNYINPATLRLSSELYNIIAPVAYITSDNTYLSTQSICLTSKMQDAVIRRVYRHFYRCSCDMSHEEKQNLACTFFTQFAADYRIHAKQQRDMLQTLREKSFDDPPHVIIGVQSLTKMQRSQSDDTASLTVGSYESTTSYMSMYSLRHSPQQRSPRQRTSSGSHVHFEDDREV